MSQEDSDRQEFDNLLGFSQNMFSEWNTPTTVYIPTRHAPVSKQLERVWMINSAEPPNNLIENSGAGGTSYRVSDSPLISTKDYEDFYFSTFMKEHKNPFKIQNEVAKLTEDDKEQSKEILLKVANEQVLLGGYYVSIVPFRDCHEAKDFFDKHNKTALFVKKEDACEGCVYNKGVKCALMHKHLADKIPYTTGIADAMLKQDVNKGLLDLKTASKLKVIQDPKQRIRSHLLATYKVKEAAAEAPRYSQSNILSSSNVTVDDLKVVKDTVNKLIKNGVNYKTLITKVGSHVGTPVIKEIIASALPKVSPINMAKFADCPDEFKGRVAMLVKDATCEECIFNEGKTCSKYKVAFVQQSKDPVILELGKKIKEANFKNKNYVESFFAKCIDSGLSIGQLKEAFTISFGKEDLSNYLDGALKQAKKVDPFKFSKCSGDYFEKVAKVYQGSNCAGCHYNYGSHCAQLNKDFVNPSPSTAPVPVLNSDSVQIDDVFNAVGKKAELMLRKGASLQQTVSVFNETGVSTSFIKQAMIDAVKNIGTINTVTLNDCKTSELVKYAKNVAYTNKCANCVYNEQNRCGMFSKEFANPITKKASVNNAVEQKESILFDDVHSEYTIDF